MADSIEEELATSIALAVELMKLPPDRQLALLQAVNDLLLEGEEAQK